MNTTLILIGIVCIIGAIIGGGVKLVQIELSPVASLWRQLLLGCFGLVLIAAGVIAGQTNASPDKAATATPVKPGPVSGTGDSGSHAIATGTSQDYVLSGSDTRQLTADDLSPLSPAQLRIARNEIYARHGRRFVSADLASYFSKKAWYQPVDGAITLSPLEQANVDLIAKFEKARG